MRSVSLFACVVFCLTTYHVQAQIAWDAEKFMPLSEVQPGMKGKGYTVFSGTTVEEFDFEVVSVYYNRFPGLHIVWAKGLSDNFKKTGSAGGMSGSPTYINGRLMGALSRSYRNQREHANLFGITPIEFMVKVTEYGMQPNLSYHGTRLFNLDTQTVATDIKTLSTLFSNNNNIYPQQPIDSFQSDGLSERLKVPVAMSGINSEAIRFYKPLFDQFNLMPLEAPGGGSPIKKSPVEQGQIVGIAYARGDYTAFGYGTITYIDGDQLLAYGHSRNGEGNINLPISGGYVHFIMPGRYRSSKVASATQIIGTLVQDRQAAIAGITGSHPPYIPVTLNMETSDGVRHQRSYEVIRHRSFTPLYIEAGAGSLVRALEFAVADYTLTIDATITLKEQPGLLSREINYKNVYSGSSPTYGVTNVLRPPLLQLSNNSYTPVEFEEVTLNLKLEDKRRIALIEGLWIDKQRYRPGETVEVVLTLRPHLENPITQIGTITIPTDAPDGLITLLAMNATTDQQWQRSRAPFNFRPKNINQLVKILQQRESNTDIIFELSLNQPGLTVQGEEFSDLPSSVTSVMNSAKQVGTSGYTRQTTLHRYRVSTNYVIFGSGALELVVDRNAH